MIAPRLTMLIPAVALMAATALPAAAHSSSTCAPVVKKTVHKTVVKKPRVVRVKTTRVVHAPLYHADYVRPPCDCDRPAEVRYLTPPPPIVVTRVHVYRAQPRPWHSAPVIAEQPVRVVYVEHRHSRYVHHWQRWPDWIGNGE